MCVKMCVEIKKVCNRFDLQTFGFLKVVPPGLEPGAY